MGSLGAIGLTALIITILSLLGSIEEAFNAIWGVREDRSFSRKFSNYLSVMASAPFLIMAAVSITTFLENQAVIRWFMDREYIGDLLLVTLKLIPYVSVWVAFTFLYLFIPNTSVRLTSALFGGVLAGTTWQVAQWGYIHFQVGVGKYNAIYGTLSLLPIFMIWLYTSWIIVLFGVEVVYAHQNRRTLRLEYHGKSLSHAARLELALTLLVECSAAFRRGTPRTAEQMAAGLGLPVRQVKDLLGELERVGFLSRLAGDNPEWHPAREPASVPVSEVLQRLSLVGGRCLIPQAGRCEELIRKVLGRAASGSEAALEGVTIGTLADLLEEQTDDASPDRHGSP
jgi:membrane protein